MATEKEFTAQSIYHDLMVEAKARAYSINTLSNDQRGIQSPLVREYAYLQLRMLCEIIALGCLVAHGDLVEKGPAMLKKRHEPGVIINALNELNNDFYPVPITPQRIGESYHLLDYHEPYLTKEELPKLWSICGGVLHKGNLKRVVQRHSPVQHNFADVNVWGQKILNLLSNHRIITKQGKLVFVVSLAVEQLGGVVQVAIAEAA